MNWESAIGEPKSGPFEPRMKQRSPEVPECSFSAMDALRAATFESPGREAFSPCRIFISSVGDIMIEAVGVNYWAANQSQL